MVVSKEKVIGEIKTGDRKKKKNKAQRIWSIFWITIIQINPVFFVTKILQIQTDKQIKKKLLG